MDSKPSILAVAEEHISDLQKQPNDGDWIGTCPRCKLKKFTISHGQFTLLGLTGSIFFCFGCKTGGYTEELIEFLQEKG